MHGSGDPKEPLPPRTVDVGTQTDVTSADIDRWIELERQVQMEEVARESRNQSQEAPQVTEVDRKGPEKEESGMSPRAMHEGGVGGSSLQDTVVRNEPPGIVAASERRLYLIGGATNIFASTVLGFVLDFSMG